MDFIKKIVSRLLPYDPDKVAVAPPTGEKKAKRKGGGKEADKTLHINKRSGQSFVKSEIETENGKILVWDDGGTSEVSWMDIKATTKNEKVLINDEGLNIEKYEKLRVHFFAGLSPRDIESHYKAKRVSGFSKSTTYPYLSVFNDVWRPKRPI